MKSIIAPIAAIIYCSLAAAEEAILFDQDFELKLPISFAALSPGHSLQLGDW